MDTSGIVGEAPELGAVLRAARLVAATDATVLIQGESGSGKELLAGTVHAHSRRAAGPFVTVNCAALPEGLAESELFGHRRGAFTGAVSDQTGLVEAADGGTLFLDEVGELNPSVQAKVLRFLESAECRPVGAGRARRVDVRVVAATNRDLYAESQAGGFRSDLYYRLHVIPLELPPLRERQGDVPVLLKHFLTSMAQRHGVEPPRPADAAVRMLEAHCWPGNVRELRNLCERLVVLCPGREIRPEDLPPEIGAAPPAAAGTLFRLPSQGVRLVELEAELMRQALERTQGNRSRAAELLGLTRDTFLYRMKKHTIA